MGNYQNTRDAILYYEHAVNANQIEMYMALGQAYYYLGEYKNAIKTYQKAIALKPDFYPLRVQLAYIYAALGQRKKAEDLLIQQNPN